MIGLYNSQVKIPDFNHDPRLAGIFRHAYQDTISIIGDLDLNNPIEVDKPDPHTLEIISACAATPFLAELIREMGKQYKIYGVSDLYLHLNDQLPIAKKLILEGKSTEPVSKKTLKSSFLSAQIIFPIPINDFTARQTDSFEVTKESLTNRGLNISSNVENRPRAVEISSSDRDRYVVGKLVMQWAAGQIGEDRRITTSAIRSYYEDAKIGALGRQRASELQHTSC